MRTRPHHKRSFTLTEVLISLVVFCLVMATSTAGFYIVFDKWKKQKDMLELLVNSRWAMMRLSKEFRRANAYDTSNGKLDLRFDVGGRRFWYWKGKSVHASGDPNTFYRFEGTTADGWNDAKNGKVEMAQYFTDLPGNGDNPFSCSGNVCLITFRTDLVGQDLILRTSVRRRN
ncbi:MAG TPA: prepilin-type N-terminal cleavage/methylation domain-containing protein [Candidatus Omnitrophota bacterium]|nr:prepilin-type N-terminal cleavage/methylation domain-containing protein [Candidatus Omnitrophota bacterium]